MDKVFVVQGVANKLWATEDAVDHAMAEASRLLAGIVEAREELKLPHLVTDSSMTEVVKCMTALSQAREALMQSHRELYEVKLRAGVRTKLVGTSPSIPEDDKKDKKKPGDPQNSAEVVHIGLAG